MVVAGTLLRPYIYIIREVETEIKDLIVKQMSRELSTKMVADAGLEPASPYGRQILSLLCIPVPPLGLIYIVIIPNSDDIYTALLAVYQ